MGDLSNIEEVAKYAARMGQCFLSTRAVAYLPVNDIQCINDIMRNGYNSPMVVARPHQRYAKKLLKFSN